MIGLKAHPFPLNYHKVKSIPISQSKLFLNVTREKLGVQEVGKKVALSRSSLYRRKAARKNESDRGLYHHLRLCTWKARFNLNKSFYFRITKMILNSARDNRIKGVH